MQREQIIAGSIFIIIAVTLLIVVTTYCYCKRRAIRDKKLSEYEVNKHATEILEKESDIENNSSI